MTQPALRVCEWWGFACCLDCDESDLCALCADSVAPLPLPLFFPHPSAASVWDQRRGTPNRSHWPTLSGASFAFHVQPRSTRHLPPAPSVTLSSRSDTLKSQSSILAKSQRERLSRRLQKCHNHLRWTLVGTKLGTS